MNAGDMYPLFAGMLTQRPWDQVLLAAMCLHNAPMLLPLLTVATLSGCCTCVLLVSAAPANTWGILQVTRRSWDHLNLKRDDAEREVSCTDMLANCTQPCTLCCLPGTVPGTPPMAPRDPVCCLHTPHI